MKELEFHTPILFVVFNRPDTTRLVFEEIRKIRPSQLFIAADGPRLNKPGDNEKCVEVRKIISNVDWPCEVKTLFREKNLGFRDAERLAFDWFFENVEEGIILEDDQLPHQDFFRFCEEMLEKYRNNEQIMMVSGGNFLPDFKINDSYFFSKYFSIWGWATWRRAWRKYDFSMKSWSLRESKKKIKSNYTQDFMIERIIKMFNDTYSKKNTWDTQWLYACLINNGLCITPKTNLITNIGIDGVHQGGHNQNIPTSNLYNEELRHPKAIRENSCYDNAFYERNFREPNRPFYVELKRWVISIAVEYESIKKIYRFLMKLLIK